MTGSFKRGGTGFFGCPSGDTMQELLTGVTFNSFPFLTLILTCTIILIISLLFLFLYFQGLNLLELAAHLEEKAAQLRCIGLGQIKIALAGTDTSSLPEILQGHFGHLDSSESAESVVILKRC